MVGEIRNNCDVSKKYKVFFQYLTYSESMSLSISYPKSTSLSLSSSESISIKGVLFTFS